MSDVRVHIERARPTCPFCKDEVRTGLVWVCSGCEAPHHAACHSEHGACATCGLTSAPAAGRDARLARVKAGLSALGFTITLDREDEVRARSPSEPAFGGRPCQVVVTDTPERLTRARLDAQGGKASGPPDEEAALFLHLADAVDVDARPALGAISEREPTHARLAWSPGSGLVEPPLPASARCAPHVELARRVLGAGGDTAGGATLFDTVAAHAPEGIKAPWLRFVVGLMLLLAVAIVVGVGALLELFGGVIW